MIGDGRGQEQCAKVKKPPKSHAAEDRSRNVARSISFWRSARISWIGAWPPLAAPRAPLLARSA
eukprot:2034180-Pyramimonas_sp.AAC.1